MIKEVGSGINETMGVLDLLKLYPSGEMETHEVSAKINDQRTVGQLLLFRDAGKA